MPATRLSSRFATAFMVAVGICVVLLGAPLYVLARQNHLSRATDQFGERVSGMAATFQECMDLGDGVSMDDLCYDLHVEFEGRVTVLDPAGDVLADSFSAHVTRGLPAEAAARRRDRRLALLNWYRPLDDTVQVRIPLDFQGAGRHTVRLALPLVPVRRQNTWILLLLLAAVAGVICVAMAVGWLTVGRIARPLELVADVAEAIAAGDMTREANVGGDDELGRLGQSVNTMQASLRVTMRDLRRERNQALAIVDSMSDGVLAISSDGEVLLVNHATQQLCGCPDLASGHSVEDAGLPTALLAAADACAASAEPVVTEWGDVRRGDRVIGVVASPVGVTDASPSDRARVVLALRDITEARRAENLGRELVANASHELRTPTAIVSSTVETLLAGCPEDDPTREFLRIIARNAERMQQLVSQTLQLSQIESGRPSGVWEQVVLGDLVAQVVELLSPNARAKAIRVTVEGDHDVELTAAQTLLVQAVYNLVDNAIRYTPEEGNVSVAIRRCTDAVEICVCDSGPGVAPAERKNIFERFVRGEASRHTSVDGSGLGLAIVRRVSEIHSGSVEAGSSPLGGACFTIRLPLTAEPDVSA